MKTSPIGGRGAKFHEAGFVQKREWMLYKIRDDHYPMNLRLGFNIPQFDHDLFQKLIDKVVKRHEVLRTTLKVRDGRLQQLVHDNEDFHVNFTYYDVSGDQPDAAQLFIKEKLTIQSNTPFNFEFGPLFRILVFKKSKNDFAVIFTFHHVIFDQYSARIFQNDAMNIWLSMTGQKVPELAIARSQYRSYSEFENALIDTELGDVHRKYWERELVNDLPRLEFIEQKKWDRCYADHKRIVSEVRERLSDLPYCDFRFLGSVVRRFKRNSAGTATYFYTAETLIKIGKFKQISRSSLHALFIAGFLKAFHKLSGQQQFAFDIPAGRKIDGDHKFIIGWLASGGICFFDITQNRNAGGLLHYIDDKLFQLSKHCIFPFEVVGFDSEVPLGSTVPVLFVVTESSGGSDESDSSTGIVQHARDGSTSYQNMDIFVTITDHYCKVHIGYDNFLITPELVENVLTEQESSIYKIIEDLMSHESSMSSGAVKAVDKRYGADYFVADPMVK